MVMCGYCAFLMLLFISSTPPERKSGNNITRVVIDAGHGGHDSGCLGLHAKEKDVALAIALKLGKFIEDNCKDVKVFYTRKTDKFVGLDERAAIANKNKADLFICIHCNSGAKAAFGIETYVMGLHKTEENLAVAKRENSVVILEKDYKKKYEGFDPDSPEGNIIFSMYQNAFLDQSLQMSTFIQKEVADFAGRFNRGVKQAGFLVLWKTSMPSLLVETGFLTNDNEERYLVSKNGQDKIAYAIYKAFAAYKGNAVSSSENMPEEKPVAKDSALKKPPVVIDTASVSKPDEKNIAEKNKEPVKTSSEWKHKTDSASKQKPDTATAVQPDNSSGEIYFTIQIATSGQLLPKNSPAFKGEKNIITDKVNGLYKYMTGKYPTLNEAMSVNKDLRAKKFKDAFVVAYRNKQRITIQEAEALLKK